MVEIQNWPMDDSNGGRRRMKFLSKLINKVVGIWSVDIFKWIDKRILQTKGDLMMKDNDDFTTDEKGRGLYKGEIIGVKAKEAAEKKENENKCLIDIDCMVDLESMYGQLPSKDTISRDIGYLEGLAKSTKDAQLREISTDLLKIYFLICRLCEQENEEKFVQSIPL